jgi:hypothetical protein
MCNVVIKMSAPDGSFTLLLKQKPAMNRISDVSLCCVFIGTMGIDFLLLLSVINGHT